MSQWTHVAGLIRFDTIQSFITGDDETFKSIIKEIIGKSVSYSDNFEGCNVPLGSEGSVEYQVILTGDAHSMARVIVPIWGDLRDYEDGEEIINWIKEFTKKLEEKGLAVRNGTVCISIEGQKYLIVSCKNNVWDIVYTKEKKENKE